MYIAPNSTVRVLRGVNIDSDYQHTVRFTNRDAQYDVLSAKTKFTFTPQTYQRTYKNSIKVEKIADDLFDCNYLMFQNTSYGNKWFYAFIDKVNYINDKCSEIEYTIDVMQSFLLDFEVGQCFVEREHSITDLVGENTVTENFTIGEYFVNKEIAKVSSIVESEMYGAIIFSKNVTELWYERATAGQFSQYCAVTKIEDLEGQSTSPNLNTIGVPNTLTILTGFCLGDEKTPDSSYFEQPATNVEVAPTIYVNNVVPSLDRILNYIREGKLARQAPHDKLTTEDIVAVYIYPKNFSLKSSCVNAQAEGLPVGYSSFLFEPSASDMPTVFTSKNNSTAYAFDSVKNKKLLTAPYLRLKYYSQGNNKDYYFENFKNSMPSTTVGLKIPQFKIYGNKIGYAEFVLQPTGYNGNAVNRTEMIQFNENMIALYSGNALATYLESNANSHANSILSSMVGGVTSAITSLVTKNPIPAIGGITSAFMSIGSKLSQLDDLRNAPPPSNYSTNIPLFVIGMEYMGGIFYSEGVTAEKARIIDDYFSMYGYATNRVKQPNIFAYFRNTSGYYLRPHWNYVKTNGAIVHPRTNYGLPAEAEKKIAQIIDNGITFWNDESEIGNYSLANDATGTP